jgi:predicted GNAT family acetyltransferase
MTMCASSARIAPAAESIAWPKTAVVAEMTLSRAGESMIIIDHTAVPEALRGRGIGEALVARDARQAGKKIVPLCPFAAAQFRRHPEFADVLSS